MDNYLFFVGNIDATLKFRERVASLLNRLGLGRNPKQSQWEPTQICEHVSLEIDTNTSTLLAPPPKLLAISTMFRTLLRRKT
jgi:hypothetical protein